MGSLADELEKVKVGLPRSKTVSISWALSHLQGALRAVPASVPTRKMEALGCKDKGRHERSSYKTREIK